MLGAGEEFGILPCGLGARNTLRLEGALSLYGHEISDTITPWEARLDRFLKMDKGEFTGRAALVNQKQRGLKSILVGLEAIERGIPRDGYTVAGPEGRKSATLPAARPRRFSRRTSPSPTSRSSILPKAPSWASSAVICIVKCKVVPTPFYKRPRPASATGSNALPEAKRPQ